MDAIEALAESICEHIPEGFQINLCMERGSAWVNLMEKGEERKLPDSADKCIRAMLNDAMLVAQGWIQEAPQRT